MMGTRNHKTIDNTRWAQKIMKLFIIHKVKTQIRYPNTVYHHRIKPKNKQNEPATTLTWGQFTSVWIYRWGIGSKANMYIPGIYNNFLMKIWWNCHKCVQNR